MNMFFIQDIVVVVVVVSEIKWKCHVKTSKFAIDDSLIFVENDFWRNSEE